ncbi:MAG TPA: aminomethyl transferase family protein [Myxococcaceae bacterium]|nr:aminomethyl transferase family protein [Myxococcaceae bacterium]
MEPLPLQLHDWHLARGAVFTALNGFEVVAHYADPAAELRAALEGAAVFDWSARGVLKVTGPDRLEFLQGMCTADVKKIAPGASAYAAFLTNKGAMVADGRLWNRAEDVVIDTEPGLLPAVRDYLQKHLVSEDAEISEDEGLAVVTDLLAPRAELQATLEKRIAAGGVLAGFDAWERARVERGTPRYGQDMDDKTIPLEAGLQKLISYDKGCYVGQEVVARATFRGHVNRQLQRLAFDTAPAVGAVLRSGDKEVGRVTSVVKAPDDRSWIGLGYVHRDATESPLALEGGGAVRIR